MHWPITWQGLDLWCWCLKLKQHECSKQQLLLAACFTQKRAADAMRKLSHTSRSMWVQVLLKQSARTTGLILVQVLLDVGAAYGAQVGRNAERVFCLSALVRIMI